MTGESTNIDARIRVYERRRVQSVDRGNIGIELSEPEEKTPLSLPHSWAKELDWQLSGIGLPIPDYPQFRSMYVGPRKIRHIERVGRVKCLLYLIEYLDLDM